MQIFSKAKVKMILRHPFFAVLALHLEEKQVEGLPTTATDGRHLFVNGAWAKTLDDEEKIFVVAHEVLHCALGHIWRRGTRDPQRWNVAADYMINLMLVKAGLKAPKDCLLDPKYEGMSAEEIYDKLPATKNEKPLCVFLEDCHGKEPGLSRKALEEEWKGILAEAAMVAKMHDKMPAGLERLIRDILEPKMRWDQLLDQLVSEVTREDYEIDHPDRRFLTEYGIYLPDLVSEKRYIAVAVDSSGSISNDDLKAFVAETVGIIRSKGVSRVRVMSCDARVHVDQVVEPHDEIPMDFPGGGGTDFRPVFERLDEDPTDKPALLVYLTDGYGTYPKDEPQYPVLWVVKNGDVEKVPFGIRVKYED
jgi:predicted metal-dependent peptidase